MQKLTLHYLGQNIRQILLPHLFFRFTGHYFRVSDVWKKEMYRAKIHLSLNTLLLKQAEKDILQKK